MEDGDLTTFIALHGSEAVISPLHASEAVISPPSSNRLIRPSSSWIVAVAVLLGVGVVAAELSAQDKQLLDACALGDMTKARALVEHGANVNAGSEVGETPLHLSSIHHNMELAEYLIAQGADVNRRAHGAASLAMAPLHWFLFMNSCTAGVEALIQKGADVNALCYNEDGGLLSPLDIADKVNREKERTWLLAKGAKRYADMDDSERAQYAPPTSQGVDTAAH
jgi:ankyrin repeat protein